MPLFQAIVLPPFEPLTLRIVDFILFFTEFTELQKVSFADIILEQPLVAQYNRLTFSLILILLPEL